MDATCGQMARYMARLVGWYTKGGFKDAVTGMRARFTMTGTLVTNIFVQHTSQPAS